MGATGLEPVTPSVSNAGSPLENTEKQGIFARPARGLHPGLHTFAENEAEPRLAALAAALVALSPEECDRLAAMLVAPSPPQQSEGNEQ
jgi:hypothetical protein